MARNGSGDDMIDGVMQFVVMVVVQAVKGLLYILFVSPYRFWGYVTRRIGWEPVLILAVGIVVGVLLRFLLWNETLYDFVDGYISIRTWHGLARYVAYFAVSWVLISPAYILFHIWRQRKDDRQAKRSLVFGHSVALKRAVMIDDAKRTEHILALGSTGTGKTTSVIEPAIQDDISKGRGLLFMTAKDDPAFIERVYSYASACGREGDVRIFTLSNSPRTDSYNPIMGSNAMALRDLCMESFSWDNPYYRDQARSALLYVLSALVETRKNFSLKDLYYIFTQKGCLDALAEQVEDPRTKQHLKSYSEDWKQHRENNRGLAANLEDYTTDRLAPRVCAYQPDINLAHSYAKNHILLFVLNSLQYGETARRLGRMIVQNLRYLSGLIAEAGCDLFYPVYIDEFHHFIFPEFFSVVAQCRSSHIGLMLSTQSFADFKGDGWDITTQIIQNTNTKIILRQNDSHSAEHAARLAGTQTVVKRTRQVENAMFTTVDTGLGSEREVEEFVIHPNKIRSLQAGRAAIIHEGTADIIDLNRAWTKLPRHNPNDRPVVKWEENAGEGIDIYGRWMAAEEAKKGEGIRRPATREPDKEAKGIDAIRANIKDKSS
jgi:type IV secretory pathway TraG/TraD family ATPase VirD4